MKNQIRSVPIERLVCHPGSPNRMSKSKFNKLVRNIERTGLYEPLIVRPSPSRTKHRDEAGISCDTEAYEIINGHQRWQALQKLGFQRVDVIVWDVDDEQADIFLATLNRLGGTDVLERKLALLKRLSAKSEAASLAKLLGQSARQIERLTSLTCSKRGRACPFDRLRAGSEQSRRDARDTESDADLQCVTFFLSDGQKKLIEKAMSLAGGGEKTKAARNAAAVTQIAERYLRR